MNRFVLILFSFFVLPSFLYCQDFYDPGRIQKIELQFSQNNWDFILDTLKSGSDEYLKAQWVKVNGTQLFNVGVKYKGSSSYDSTYKKNPLHIELNSFQDQNYNGLVDIKLGNSYADPSMVREVLAYNFLKNYMDCPRSNFAQVYINGVYMGLYANDEAINNMFCREHFYSDKGVFVKCNPIVTPAPNVKCNLKYISSGDSSSYFNYYEVKSKTGWKNLQALCDSITNKPNNMSSIVDIDRMIWMLAFNTLVVNLDSYNGVFAQNYYLYKNPNSHFLPIPWDLNMSFGGFPFLGNSNTSLASLSIANMQVLPLNIHANDPYWPLIKAVNANSTYKKMYIAHLKTMLEEYFANGQYLTDYQKYKNLIDTALINDTKMFFTYSQFQNALTANCSVGSYSVPGLQTLMAARVSYLQSTSDLTQATPSVVSVNAVQSPTLNSAITLTAQVINGNSVTLAYRFKTSELFQKVQMLDDGLHQDGVAGDQVFGTSVSFTNNQMQYYLYAENNSAGIFSPQRAEHEFYEIHIWPHPQKGELVINEYLADNKSDVRNEFNMLADWIEIYNTSNSTLGLSDYYLSNSLTQRTSFAFPANSTIPPHGFVVVWADEVLQQGTQLHANFNLSKNGDQVVLSDGLKLILDSTSFGGQTADVSVGRCPDGIGMLLPLKYPSYGMPNCVVGLEEENQSLGSFLIFPNPTRDKFYVRSLIPLQQKLNVYTLFGQLIVETSFENLLELDTTAWPNGFYIASCGGITKKLIVNR